VEFFYVAAIFPIVDGYESVLSTLLIENFDGMAFDCGGDAGRIEGDVLILEQDGRRHFAGIGREFAG